MTKRQIIFMVFLWLGVMAGFYVYGHYVWQQIEVDMANVPSASSRNEPTRPAPAVDTSLPVFPIMQWVMVETTRSATSIEQRRPTFPSLGSGDKPDGPMVLALTPQLTVTVDTAILTTTTTIQTGWQWQVEQWDEPAWLPLTADCGQGTTVIAGHSVWGDDEGPFYTLPILKVGDGVRCQDGNGRWHDYQVRQIRQMPFDSNPDWVQLAQPNELVLYTCSLIGDGLIVVWAAPIADTSFSLLSPPSPDGCQRSGGLCVAPADNRFVNRS